MNAKTPVTEQTTSDPFKKFKQHFFSIIYSLLSEDVRKAYYAVSIIAGLSIFFLYFSHINYTPRISLTDSVMLIFSALIIGVGASLIMAGLFILPSQVWRDLLDKNLEDGQPQRFKYIFFRQGIALLALITFALSAILYDQYWLYLLAGAALTLVLWLVAMRMKRQELKRNTAALLVNTFVMAFCTLMLVNIALHGVENINDSDTKETTARLITFTSTAFVLLANIFLVSFKKAGLLRTTLAAIALLAVVMIASQSVATIPKGVMHILGLGNFQAEEIILDNELCEYFKTVSTVKTNQINTRSCSLEKPWILWKGEDAVLIKLKNTKFQIDKKYIKLISYNTF